MAESTHPQSSGPDPRLAVHRDTNTVFEPRSFETREDWERFSAYLEMALRVSCALFHEREWAPMNPQISGTIVRNGYTVEKVAFEATPGFLVTGNLYRPRGEGPYPVVACPHGHWAEGRLEDSERGSVPGRCITFARMGIISFSYDMVGYVDSTQMPFDWGHFSDMPVEARHREHLWGIHPFSVQLWTSLRVVDFLQGLPGVDPSRVGCVGASGGGSQTFALSAIDDRVTHSAPVTMISHTMQGGCTCENAPLIRLHASNVEIGAMAAPRPMVMVSATGDWTRATPEVEFPATQAIYALYDAADAVSNTHIDAPHNFNQASREAVYRFLAEHFLGDEVEGVSFDEPEFTVEPPSTLRVFPGGPPEGSAMGDEQIARWIEDHRKRARKGLVQHAGDAQWHDELRRAWAIAMGMGPDFDEVRFELVDEATFTEGFRTRDLTMTRTVANGSPGGTISVRTWQPETVSVPIRLVVVVHPEGPGALSDSESLMPGPWVRPLLEAGCVVVAPGVFNPDGREYGRFDDTFAPTDTAWRVQDIAAVANHFRDEWSDPDDGEPKVILAGLEEAGMWCWLAAPLLRRVNAVLVDAKGFAHENDDAWAERCYVPSIRSLGGLEAATQLLAPAVLTVHGLEGTPPEVGARHAAMGAPAPQFLGDSLRADSMRAAVLGV